MLDRSIPTRKALVHSIPISEVKDMKSVVLRALKTSLSEEKNFEPCLRAIASHWETTNGLYVHLKS
jgi:hypothetical protein